MRPATTRTTRLSTAALLAALLAGCGGTEPTVTQDVAAEPTPVLVEEPDADPDPDPEPEEPEPEEVEEPDDDGLAVGEGEPIIPEVCEGREAESFIEVVEPAPNATISSPFVLSGCGNTFEATYSFRIEAGGAVVLEDFAMMTCGNGCVGTFVEDVVVDVTGPATIVVFETSAEDGSEVNVVEVPVTFE